MPHPRREARERALELLYEAEAKGVHPAEVVASLPVPPLPYAGALAEGVGDHLELLDHVIGSRARRWTVPRMPAVDRALLRQATYELAFEPDVPVAVAIDEAVDLAREFSTEASSRFVNGVLSRVAEDVRDGGPWAGARRPRALVVDCDGVVRHWDAASTRELEASLGVPPGALEEVALEPSLLREVTTGAIGAEAWAAEVGRRLAERHGADPDAVTEAWLHTRWTIDQEVVDLVRAVAAAGVRTACFSNATDRLEADLAASGVDDAFATIVNSARVGEVKPEAAFYRAACEAVGLGPGEVLFVDDRRENVLGALACGIHAVTFHGPARLRAVLARCGLLAG